MAKLTPLRRIRNYCKESCCAGDTKSWKECTLTDCMLFPLRMGKNEKSYRIPRQKKDSVKKGRFLYKENSTTTIVDDITRVEKGGGK